MKLIFASDHAGVEMKQALIDWAETHGHECADLGTHSTESVDYPDYSVKVAKALEENSQAMGVLLCGSGIGVSIAANRFSHVRAALCHSVELAHMSRAHNDANVLCLASRYMDDAEAINCMDEFLNTGFEGGRHQRRVESLSNLP